MINLSIQDPLIPVAALTNIYELEVHSEHGDGDKSEYTIHHFAPNAHDMGQLHTMLEILEAYEKAGSPYAITTTDWCEFIDSQNIDVDHVKYIEDCISELLAWDVTNNGQYLTTYQGYSLVFYDVNGLKRPVTVEHTNGTN